MSADGHSGVHVPSFHPEALHQALSALPHGGEQHPVHFVSIIGALRSGKSTLLTRLAGLPTQLRRCSAEASAASTAASTAASGLFPVAHSASSCTRGIDIAQRALARNELVGAADEHADGRVPTSAAPPSLLLLDVQGTGSEGDGHDLRLLTPAVAVSSAVIWRVAYEGRDRLLGQLHLLQMVAGTLRNGEGGGTGAAGAAGGGAVFGHLIIALKDAEQYEAQPGAIEAELFQEEDEAAGGAAAAKRNAVRRSVSRAFSGVTVLPMASPREDEGAYMRGVHAIGRQVHAVTADTRCLFANPAAPVLASTAGDMLQGLVQACRGATVDVQCTQMWEMLQEKQLQRACDAYRQQLRRVCGAGSSGAGSGAGGRRLSVADALQLAAQGRVVQAMEGTAHCPPLRRAVGRFLETDWSAEAGMTVGGDDDPEQQGGAGGGSPPLVSPQSSAVSDSASLEGVLLGDAGRVSHSSALRCVHELMSAEGVEGGARNALCALERQIKESSTLRAFASVVLSLRQEVVDLLGGLVASAVSAQQVLARDAGDWAAAAIRRKVHAAGKEQGDTEHTHDSAEEAIACACTLCKTMVESPSAEALGGLQTPGGEHSKADAVLLNMARGIPSAVLQRGLTKCDLGGVYRVACAAAADAVMARQADRLQQRVTALQDAAKVAAPSKDIIEHVKTLQSALKANSAELQAAAAEQQRLKAQLQEQAAQAAAAHQAHQHVPHATTPTRSSLGSASAHRSPAVSPAGPPMRSPYTTPTNPTRSAAASTSGSSTRSSGRAPNSWNEFQKSVAGQGLTPTQRSQLYHSARGTSRTAAAPAPSYTARASPAPSYRSSYSSSAGTSASRSGGGGNAWNSFQRAHKGQGLSSSQMSAMYRASKR